jgi:hypothetical protein
MHGFVRSKSLKELIIYMRRAVVMWKRFKIKAEWSKTIAKLFKTICYHYPSLGAELKENFSIQESTIESRLSPPHEQLLVY